MSPKACPTSANICQSEYYITLKLPCIIHPKSIIVQGSWMNTSPTCASKLKSTSDSQFWCTAVFLMFYEGKLLTEAKQKREWVNEWNTVGNRDMRRSYFVQDFHSVPEEKCRWNSKQKKCTKTADSLWCTLLFEVIRDSQPGKCLAFHNLFLISTSQ